MSLATTLPARFRPAAFWLLAPLVCLAIYWPGLIAWFQQDDFAWLSLLREVREGRSLPSALFTPMAQGSLRPLGERAYYLGLHALFGLNALPFRALAFLVQFASLTLVVLIVRRMTGSRAAGFAAALLWTANANLYIVMSWSAEFMLILCGFFLLAALDQFQRYAESGAPRRLAATWLLFLTGFGALESNAVFPLLAASWAVLFARRHLWSTLPMFAVSGLYTVMHALVAPKSTEGPYAIQVSWRMLETLATYWHIAFVPVAAPDFSPSLTLARAFPWIATPAAALYVAFQWRRGRRQPFWFLCWFLITLLPVLPLPGHISDYYLTLPVLGLAMLAADALLRVREGQLAFKVFAGALVIAFLVIHLPTAYSSCRWWYDRSLLGRQWLEHVRRERQAHPGKALVYQGFSDVLYYNVLTHPSLAVIGAHEVFAAPGTAALVGDHARALANAGSSELSPEGARALFERGALVAYQIGDRKITSVRHPRDLIPELRRVAPIFAIDLGRAEAEERLLEGWYSAGGGARWMAARSVMRISCDDPAPADLYLRGRVTAPLLRDGPARLTVLLNGRPAGAATLTNPDSAFDLSFPFPPDLANSQDVELTLICDRSFRAPPDVRQLSLIFGTIGIRRATGEALP